MTTQSVQSAFSTCQSIEELHSFCKSFEGETALKANDKTVERELSTAIHRLIPDEQPLRRFVTLFSIHKPHLSESDIKDYTQVALGLLERHMLQYPEEDLHPSIRELTQAGISLQQIEELFTPRLEKLSSDWEQAVKDLATFSATDPDALTVLVSDAREKLQKRIADDTSELLRLSESLPQSIRSAILCRATGFQSKAILDLTARAMNAHVAIVAKTDMSQEELESTQEWMENLQKDVHAYLASPMARDIQALNELVSHLEGHIQTIRAKIADFKAHPEFHPTRMQRALKTAAKVGRVVWRALKWFPFLALYVMPVALAARAGYKAEGRRGALFAAGVATATTIISGLAPLIAEKVKEQVPLINAIPVPLRSTVESIYGLSIQMMTLLIAMQFNGLIAGSLASLTTAKPEVTPRPWYGRRLWDAAGDVKDAWAGAAFGIPSFLSQEYGLGSALISTPQHYGALVGRIANVAQAQIEAQVAGYKLGAAAVAVPQATITLLGTIVGQ